MTKGGSGEWKERKRGKKRELVCECVCVDVCVRERGRKDIESVGAPVVCVCVRVCVYKREREPKKSFLKIPSDF